MAKNNGKGKSESKELATLDNYVLATLDREALAEIMEENLSGESLGISDFERIKVPAGGGLAWEILDEDGEPDSAKEIEGIIVHHHTARTFWAEGLDQGGGGTPPDCFSSDGKAGLGTIPGDDRLSRDCATCPLNQFGTSEKGKGKACKETRVLYVLFPGELLPTVVSVPPTSIKAFRKYLLRLVSKQVPLSGITTRFTLDRATNANNINYSTVSFERGTALPPEMREKVQGYGDTMRALVSRMGSSASFVAEVAATEEEPQAAAAGD